MRILLISNRATERCGVRLHGELFADALERAGHRVTRFDGTYSTVYAEGYLPFDVDTYDLIHLNWDPQTINHYLPLHFAGHPPLSLFLHDVPPNSTCPVWDVARWRFAEEAGGPGVIVVDKPVPPTPEGVPLTGVWPGVVIGVSGIREDPGSAMVAEVCERYGWALNAPYWWNEGPWLATENEIRRLARSTINVCWYQTTGRGKSMAAMFAVASGRPLLVSSSTMFSPLYPWADEIYIADPGDDLAPLLHHIVYEVERGAAKHPARINMALSWDRVIATYEKAWAA